MIILRNPSEIKNMFPTQMSETSGPKQNGGKQR